MPVPPRTREFISSSPTFLAVWGIYAPRWCPVQIHTASSYCPCGRTTWLRFGAGGGGTNLETLQKLEKWGRAWGGGGGGREKENQDRKGQFALGCEMESQLHFPEQIEGGDGGGGGES